MIPAPVAAVLCDVDGVLTPGRLGFAGKAPPAKEFHIHDGHGLKLLMQRGVAVAWVTARADDATAARAVELGVELLVKDGGHEKDELVRDWLHARGVRPAQAVYVGDDLFDLPAFAVVGWPVAVADAVLEVRRAARRVTRRRGGHGAVREVAGWVLGRRTGR